MAGGGERSGHDRGRLALGEGTVGEKEGVLGAESAFQDASLAHEAMRQAHTSGNLRPAQEDGPLRAHSITEAGRRPARAGDITFLQFRRAENFRRLPDMDAVEPVATLDPRPRADDRAPAGQQPNVRVDDFDQPGGGLGSPAMEQHVRQRRRHAPPQRHPPSAALRENIRHDAVSERGGAAAGDDAGCESRLPGRRRH